MRFLLQNSIVIFLLITLPIQAKEKKNLNMVKHKVEQNKFPNWNKGKLAHILICPKVLSVKNDPLAGPSDKDGLSVMGFGRIDEKDSSAFVANMLTKELKTPRLSGGFHAELYLLFKDLPFADQDKVSCYISEKSVDIKISDRNGGFIWIGLPDACVKLINEKFIVIEPKSQK